MANILRATAVWSGFSGAPGYTNFYFRSALIGTPLANAATGKTRAFFQTMAELLPTGVSVTVDPVVAEIDEETGLQGDEFNSATAPAVVIGSAPGERSAPSGLCVNWRTSTFLSGRRVRGRTFIVPCSIAVYEGDGTIKPGYLTIARNAATALRTESLGFESALMVWHRPVNGAGGSAAAVTGHTVNDKAAVLTSRR